VADGVPRRLERAHVARGGQPSELQRQDQHEHRAEQEVRDGHTEGPEPARQGVDDAPAPVRGGDGEGNADQKPEGRSRQREAERDGRPVLDRLDDGLAGAQRFAEVAARDAAKPDHVLDGERAVEAEPLADGGELLLAGVFHADQRHRRIARQ
jgi:hypothetical protein